MDPQDRHVGRFFDCTPEVFDDSVSSLASLGSMVQVMV